MHNFRYVSRLAAVVVGLIFAAAGPATATAHGTSTDLTYANGNTYTMVTPVAVPATNSGLQSMPPIWVMVFAPNAIPPGYSPQCDPCDHPNNPNLPAGGDYHDHLLPGAPGFGTDGTAGEYKGPWLITILVFNPAFTKGNSSFAPITTDSRLAAVEAASAAALAGGGVPEFLPINQGATNPFERSTGLDLICPIVGPS